MFLRRVGAYLLDIILIALVASIIGVFVPKDEEYDTVLTNQIGEMIKTGNVENEYLEEIQKTTYKIAKGSVGVSIVSISIYFLYFVVLPFYNNGQTFGKKLTKIRINSRKEKTYFWQYIVRGIFIYPFFFSLIEVILLLSLSEKAYLNASTMVSNFQFILMIICVLMILFNNGIGLHDLVSQTEVIFDELEEDESGNMSKWKEKKEKETVIKKGINSDRVKNHTKRKGE